MIKFCPTCNQEKKLNDFNKNKTRKDGLQRECRDCCHNHHNKHYKTKKSPRLKENLKEGYKICTCCKQELLYIFFNKQKGGRFNLSGECKDCLHIRNKKWKENGGRQWENNYQKNRKQNDPIYKLKYCIRLRINEIIKKNNITKLHSGLKYLGCDVNTYKTHLESQFKNGMTWENHGTYWEVDHIYPLDLINSEQDCYTYFNYKNTQPLTISENRSKKNKLLF